MYPSTISDQLVLVLYSADVLTESVSTAPLNTLLFLALLSREFIASK